MKTAVFWDAAPCSVVNIDRCFREAYCPDDGGSKILQNVGEYLPEYTTQHPRKVIFSICYVLVCELKTRILCKTVISLLVIS
jgi:hypothetical protein